MSSETKPLTDERLAEIETFIPHWKPCAKSPKWRDALRECVAEVRRLRGVVETNTSCLDAEYDAHVVTMKRLRASQAAVAEESKRADELKSQAQKVSARQQRALDWLMRRYVKLRQDRAEAAARELRDYVEATPREGESDWQQRLIVSTAWLDEAEVRDG